MVVKRFSDFSLNEKLDLVDLGSKMSDEYTTLKTDILKVVNDILEETSSENVKTDDLNQFISEYISKGKEGISMLELVSDNSIFNFYLKNKSDIDELLTKSGYFKESPSDNNVTDLYDVMIDGTKQAIVDIMVIIQKEIK